MGECAPHLEETVFDHITPILVKHILEREDGHPDDLLLGAAFGHVDELRDDARGTDGGLGGLVEAEQPHR